MASEISGWVCSDVIVLVHGLRPLFSCLAPVPPTFAPHLENNTAQNAAWQRKRDAAAARKEAERGQAAATCVSRRDGP